MAIIDKKYRFFGWQARLLAVYYTYN
jgi:hypothetical protein